MALFLLRRYLPPAVFICSPGSCSGYRSGTYILLTYLSSQSISIVIIENLAGGVGAGESSSSSPWWELSIFQTQNLVFGTRNITVVQQYFCWLIADREKMIQGEDRIDKEEDRPDKVSTK